MDKLVSMDENSVRKAYARWAPVYDASFGKIANSGRVNAVKSINKNTPQGKVLEVGVGTGMSLPNYGDHLEITGIDLSPEMLEKAKARINKKNLNNVVGIHEMDAGNLEFQDNSFDIVVAMYVITVVPDPAQVMSELERVCKPGGEVILVNHFSQEKGVRGFVERKMAPFAKTLGWRPEFPITNVYRDGLKLIETKPIKPFGIFTMLRFIKDASGINANNDNSNKNIRNNSAHNKQSEKLVL